MAIARLLISTLSTILLMVSLLYLTLASNLERNQKPHDSDGGHKSFQNLLYFRSPGSLFSPSATISLTDDNSTFFAARPAAFGPLVPSKGLSGQIWIGSGFMDVYAPQKGIIVKAEGELGCYDIPSREASTNDHWHGMHMAGKVALLSRGGCSFSDKVKWAERRGASAVIVGDNVPGGPLVRMYAHGDISNISIPSLFTSHTTAHLLSSLVPPYVEDDIQDRHHMSLESSPIASEPSSGEYLDGDHSALDHLAPRHREMRPDISDRSFRTGLWVTLTLTGVSTSPFFNTLFVLVVSPLITLAVVYAMLLVRSRIRRRRWRAPKSIVEQLPVRIYRVLSGRSSPTRASNQRRESCSERSPLLSRNRDRSPHSQNNGNSRTCGSEERTATSTYGSLESTPSSEEKSDSPIPPINQRTHSHIPVECSVCLEEYVDGVSKIMSLPCGHEFHADCITPWLTTRRRTCPICKGDVVRSLSRASPTLGSQDDGVEELMHEDLAHEYDDVQTRAAESVSRTPASALPIPQGGRLNERDVERGRATQSNPETGSGVFAFGRALRQARRGFGALNAGAVREGGQEGEQEAREEERGR